uniref:Calpain catalytic domain-containing protein n=1 Tax=Lepeophtheirus salmonis TaxID=72036 RepID=A0A0K2TNJ9_LEPSM
MSNLGLQDILHLAQRAVKYDEAGNHEPAIYYYREVAQLLQQSFPSTFEYTQKAEKYKERAKTLEKSAGKTLDEKSKNVSEDADFLKAVFLVEEGLSEDEAGNSKEAIELYGSAVELCLKARSTVKDAGLKDKLSQLASEALTRAEKIKNTGKKVHKPAMPPLGLLKLDDEEANEKKSRGHGYSEEEKRVLAKTSLINGREYVPFMSVDFKERFGFPMPFNDKHGKLSVSIKQKMKLKSWSRPEEFMKEPKIFEVVDCYSVKQTVVSDCSFLASIAVAAQYEKKFKKRLISSIIFPKNKNGDPVYNPCGKYMVKLRVNGVSRKVVIDDFLPLGDNNELICSYSSNRNELWVSLLEKAYMKVMGGYDFPGSNSNIDLYALTGWIPERLGIKKNDPNFEKDKAFKKIHDRFHKGDVLVTFATGDIGDFAADRAGLVQKHAYAMLDVREVNGVKLFLVKNPWAHLRWRGNYSEIDNRNWTRELKAALNYNPESAANFDNGVFWIDFDSVLEFFEVIYMNWNPNLFKFSYSIHQSWDAGVGPVKDMFYFSNNPQYLLELTAPGPGALWILLSRHITDIEDFKNNKEYIALMVYKNKGKRIYYPVDPPPFLDAVKINTPLYLVQTVIKDDTDRKFTLVVSQFEKSTTINYSLRVFSTLPFTLRKLEQAYKYKKEITNGQWKGSTAGGSSTFGDEYKGNPRYQLKIDTDSEVLVELKGPRQFFIGFDIMSVVVANTSSPKFFNLKQSGPFRPAFAVLALDLLAGTYDIIPCTFKPKQESPFFLTVQCTSPFKLGRLS